MERKKVIVVGATGSLGTKIAKELLATGANVTAMVRTTSNRSKLESLGVKNFVIGDMLDKTSLENALGETDFDAIVSSAAGYTRHTKGDNPNVDTIGYRNLVDATKNAGIPRFVLISILESDKAVNVPHFYNKFLTEQYLREKEQPFIALRPGAFFDWNDKMMINKIRKGKMNLFFYGVDYGTINTSDLARYVAMAATVVPDTELNSTVDVGWSTPVNNSLVENAFKTVLNKPFKVKPIMPIFVFKILAPVLSLNSAMKDLVEMINWVKTGDYVSKNTQKQQELFGDLPTIEEGVKRYCKQTGII
ncbi:MAG: SDR family oxidoreductase [Paludibacter sp.]